MVFTFFGLQKRKGTAMRLLVTLLTSAFFLSACETIQGAGEDIEDTGEAIEEGVEDEE